jgi:uncharacterized coiled-coil DUF342 family protein
MNILVIIGSSVSLLTSIVAIVVVIANLRSNVDALNKQEERMTQKIDEAVSSLHELVVTVEKHIAQQGEINKVVAHSLETVVQRCESCREVSLQQDGVAALLAEMLRHKKIVDIG